MKETRLKIHKLITSLGKNFLNTSISDLHSMESLKKNLITTPLVDFDFSKQRINKQVIDSLLEIPDRISLKESLRNLINGEHINLSEKRKVAHTIYRSKRGKEGFELVFSERGRIRGFLKKIKSTPNLKNLICISIGGSRLGPELLDEFNTSRNSIAVYFCSSYDLLEIQDTFNACKQEETIVLVSSKSFETIEILKNLKYAKSWMKRGLGESYKNRLYGISSDKEAMKGLGIKDSNQFVILDSLGGRFSIWSSISLPAFINPGYDSYLSFLEGAYLADQHTLSSPWDKNIPVIMALLGVWNSNGLNINNHGIFTYNFRLRSLSKYLAQLSMESNGKSLNFEGNQSPFSTSPLIWGGYGVEAQHSVFQWLMQGKTKTSCDFIGINDKSNDFNDSHKMLLSQVIAMTFGEDNKDHLYKSIEGNNPCSILQLRSLEYKSLGFLIALYEHKVFIESQILGIDPFDQWGVELGKRLTLKTTEDSKFLSDFYPKKILPKL